MGGKTIGSLKKMFELWTMDGAAVRGYFGAKFERQLCERECFSSA